MRKSPDEKCGSWQAVRGGGFFGSTLVERVGETVEGFVFDIISHHVVSQYIISCHIISQLIISYHVTSYHIKSNFSTIYDISYYIAT